MGNPIKRIESPASTALQVIEARKLFHLVTVIVYGNTTPCTTNMPKFVILCLLCHNKQRWSRGHKARDQRNQKSGAKDSPSENRPSRGQGQECSRPRTRTQAQVFSKKKGLQKFFSGVLQKKGHQKFFSGDRQILTIQKIVLSSSRGQGNFGGLEAFSPRLDLRGQG